MRSNAKPVSISRPRATSVTTYATTSARESDLAKLAGLIRAYAPHDGGFPLRIPGLHLSRYSRISPACTVVKGTS